MHSNPHADRIIEGEAFFTSKDFRKALSTFEEVLAIDPANVEALNDAGMACAALNDALQATQYYEQALRHHPSSAPAFFNLIDVLVKFGDLQLLQEAFVRYESAIPDSAEKQHYMIAIFGGGDGQAAGQGQEAVLNPNAARLPYYEVLEVIHAELSPRTYVESGVDTGLSLALADDDTLCIGIDPESKPLVPLPPKVKLFSETSDAFFRNHNLAEELDGKPVDFGFIDGMKLFENALRDFIHLEGYATPDAVIVVKDCYPGDAAAAHRDRQNGASCGDVWKLVPCLKRYRPDLTIHTVDVAPAGLTVITGLDPGSMVLIENLEAIYREYIPRTLEVPKSGREDAFNRVGNSVEEIRALLVTVSPAS
ncbi:MAG TPA: tetratricopeptide repeat protein [Rhodothermales bacterium]|nr:tetratricopeptide repeat protein [Rhodothermales bacterium]